MNSKIKNISLSLLFALPLIVGALNAKRPDVDPFVKVKATPFAYPYLNDEPKFSNQFQFNHLNRSNVFDTYRGEGVTVAIIDSGLNSTHEDFFDGAFTNILPASASLAETGVTYSSIKIETVAEKGRSILEDDEFGHGTNVAGTVAALVNGVGTAGIASKASLLILKVDFYMTTIERAIRYAADNGADVINMSLGAYNESFIDGYGEYQEGFAGNDMYLQNAINYAYNKGITVVAAAGNEKTNKASYPASNANVIGVGALERNSSTIIADYSNSGLHNVDIVAPGSVYVSDVPNANSYGETQGTSFSSPIVAAAAALYKGKKVDATPSEIEQKLKETAFDLGVSGPDATFGHGRLDLTNLLNDIPVTGVSLDPSSLTLRVGETSTLQATIEPYNASNKNHIFISENESIATVDEDTGLVTAKSEGTTRIGVLTDDLFEDFCEVTILPAGASLEISALDIVEDTIDLVINSSQTLNINRTPSNATFNDMNFTSSHPDIISVTNAGVVSALKPGSATISVSAKVGSASDTVIINSLNVIKEKTSYSFTSSTWNATPSNWTSIKNAFGYDASLSRVQITSGNSGASALSPRTYSNIENISLGYSTNSSNGSGSIKVYLADNLSGTNKVEVGSFSVTAVGGTKRRDTTLFIPSGVREGYVLFEVLCSVNSIYIHDIEINHTVPVSEPVAVSSVNFDVELLSLYPGNSRQLTYQVLPLGATNKEVSFTSSNEGVVSVNNEGLVSAIAFGNAQITVTTKDGNFTDTMIINVKEALPSSLILDTTNFKTTYKFGETIDLSTLKATYYGSDGSANEVLGTDLSLVSGSSKVLGISTLTIGYIETTATLDINVTNIGALVDSNPIQKKFAINFENFSPALTVTPTTYDNLVHGEYKFSGTNLRYVDGTPKKFMIATGGSFFNKTAFNEIVALRIDYLSGGSPAAVQDYSFGTSPILSKPSTVKESVNTSTAGTSKIINAPVGSTHFRLDVSNKNLQANITVIYKEDGTPSFSASEQASAYVNFFMLKTGEECAVNNVLSTTWEILENEYLAMSEAAKDIVKSTINSALHARYIIIVNGYGYNDFIFMTNLSANNEVNVSLNNQVISLLVISSIGLFAAMAFLYKKRKVIC